MSDSDEDFMVAYLALECIGAGSTGKETVPDNIPIMTGYQWVELTLQNPVECYNMFRMSRSVFLSLHDTLVQNFGLKSSRRMCTKETLGMFLWTCGAPQSFRQVKNKFGHSLETISRKFDDMLEALMKLASQNIRPKDPQFGTVHPKLQEARFWPHFQDCIGAIDGTHIPVTVPALEMPKYIGRHGYPSQNVMAVCDFDMRFTFVVTGWPGSVHDTRVLLDTLLTYKDQFPKPPNGKYYLVDSGYPNRKGFLAPYKGQRYHVSEWQHHQPVGLKEVFNQAHASLRNVIERSFGLLKMKWRILLNLPSYPVTKQSKIIVACMALHNFIRDNAIADLDFESDVEDTTHGASEPSIGDSGESVDESDMVALRDAIAESLMA